MKIIPMPVKRFMSNTKTAEFVENTMYAVGIETALKMVGRPTFIMMDKEADSPEKRKYAAVKEMLYQGLCLFLYGVFMTPVKSFIYNKLSKFLSKNPENKVHIDHFNRMQNNLHELEEENRLMIKSARDKFHKKELKKEAYDKILKLKESFETRVLKIEDSIHSPKYDLRLGKGAKELSAIISSILMLTIVAPQVSHVLIHPIMNALGFEKKPDKTKH